MILAISLHYIMNLNPYYEANNPHPPTGRPHSLKLNPNSLSLWPLIMIPFPPQLVTFCPPGKGRKDSPLAADYKQPRYLQTIQRWLIQRITPFPHIRQLPYKTTCIPHVTNLGLLPHTVKLQF